MDPEQTFIRVQERFSQILKPRVRDFLEYTFLFVAITLFCILVVMHANYVQQPGCSSELTGVELSEAELLHIKITSAGLWSRSDESTAADVPQVKAAGDNLQVSKTDQGDSLSSRHTARILRGVRKIWNIIGIPLNLDLPKLLHVLYMDRVNYYAVQWLERRTQEFEPTYLYTMEKLKFWFGSYSCFAFFLYRGYFLLPDEAKSRHNIRTANVSISARHPCFGNRWQQLTIKQSCRI
ncbi:unnamed protein product [Brassica napus]|nr:unnamed protein product [Brassica napus]